MQSKRKNGEINQYWRNINSKKPIERGEQTADMHHNVRITLRSVCTSLDNSVRINLLAPELFF